MTKRSTDEVIDRLRRIGTAHVPAGWEMDVGGPSAASLTPPCQVALAFFPTSGEDQSIRLTFTVSPAGRLTALVVDARSCGGDFTTVYATGLPHLQVCLPAPRRLDIDLRGGLAAALRSFSVHPGWDTVDGDEAVPTPFALSATRVVVGCLLAAALSRLSGSDRQRVRNLPLYGALLVVADCPIGLGDEVAAALAGVSGLTMVAFGRWASAPSLPGLAHVDLRLRGKTAEVEFDEATLHRMMAANHNVVVTAAPGIAPPRCLQLFRPLMLTLPPFDRRLLRTCLRTLYRCPVRIPPRLNADDSWIAKVIPADIERAVRAASTPGQALALIAEEARARFRRAPQGRTPRLADLAGLGEARRHLLAFIADLQAARRGEVDWADLPRGFLLAGPPGVGKTTIARAVAGEVDCHFVVLSPAELQAVDHLGHHLRAIRAAFAEARTRAPSILFIDEADAIGSRAAGSSGNTYYHTAVINCFLDELQGFDATPGVMVVAATNRPQALDPALRRPGRLDRTIFVDLPDTEDRAAIWRHYLAGIAAADVDVRVLADLTAGASGADIERHVRDAKASARRRGGQLIAMELLRRIILATPDLPAGMGLASEIVRAVAVHEAGHAVLQALEHGPHSIHCVSVLPRPGGIAGLTAMEAGGGVTLADFNTHLRILLAGRAAEALVLGAAGTSAGAGQGTDSDLARATRLALAMEASFGFGDELVWLGDTDDDRSPLWLLGDPALRLRVETRLRAAFDEATAMLSRCRDTLDRLVEALLVYGEMDGPQLRRVLAGLPAQGMATDPGTSTDGSGRLDRDEAMVHRFAHAGEEPAESNGY